MPQMHPFPDLPTWVPNFTSFRTEWLLGPQPTNYKKAFAPIFNASFGGPISIPNLAEANKTNILAIQGLEIDRVYATHPDSPIRYPDYLNPDAAFFEAYWNFAYKRPAASDAYMTQEARFTAFLRTLTAGARNHDTDESLSDAYLWYYVMQFFSRTPLEQRWRAAGFRGDLSPNAKDWYLESKPDAKHGEYPPISLDKLCFFKFVMDVSGRIALAPAHKQPGDRICVMFGCSSPLLLCEAPNKPGYFELRGEVYMHDVMFGEAIEIWKLRQLKVETFSLI
jgi:hypothetical protein